MHKKLDETKSMAYIKAIRKILIDRGYIVHLNLGNSPDDDILMAYNTKYMFIWRCHVRQILSCNQRYQIM